MDHAGGFDRAGVDFVFSTRRVLQRQCGGAGRQSRAELDRAGGRVRLGPAVSNFRVCRVPPAHGHGGHRVALVPKPDDRFADRYADWLRALVTFAPCPALASALRTRGARSDPRGRHRWCAGLKRAARQLQLGSLCGRLRAFLHRPFHDHELFLLERACLGQRPERPHRCGREARDFAKGTGALARLARRARTAAPAAACGGVPAYRQKTGSTAVHWKGRAAD